MDMNHQKINGIAYTLVSRQKQNYTSMKKNLLTSVISMLITLSVFSQNYNMALKDGAKTTSIMCMYSNSLNIDKKFLKVKEEQKNDHRLKPFRSFTHWQQQMLVRNVIKLKRLYLPFVLILNPLLKENDLNSPSFHFRFRLT